MKIEIEGFPTIAVELRGKMDDPVLVLSLPGMNVVGGEIATADGEWLKSVYDSQGQSLRALLIGDDESWELTGMRVTELGFGDSENWT